MASASVGCRGFITFTKEIGHGLRELNPKKAALCGAPCPVSDEEINTALWETGQRLFRQ